MGSSEDLTDSREGPPPLTPILERPPIVEVVCGLVFDPLPLDGMLLGVYWDERKDDFPKRSLQPPLVDGLHLVLHPEQVRAIGLATQVDGVVPVAADGRPLRDAIIWMDRRAVAQCDA
jgi:hypothetical protein